MIVAILVIGYVLVLRHFDKKNRERDRQKLAEAGLLQPPDYASLKRSLEQMATQLTQLEVKYQELARRMEVSQ